MAYIDEKRLGQITRHARERIGSGRLMGMSAAVCGPDGHIYTFVEGDAARTGEKLTEKSLSAFKAQGINKAALLVFKRNEIGNAFWEKQGFTLREDVNYRNIALTELVRIDT